LTKLNDSTPTQLAAIVGELGKIRERIDQRKPLAQKAQETVSEAEKSIRTILGAARDVLFTNLNYDSTNVKILKAQHSAEEEEEDAPFGPSGCVRAISLRHPTRASSAT